MDDNRIKTELERIKVYFEDLPENKLAIIEPLIQNSAFMRITLEDLQAKIAEDGVVETYMNGANQYGVKQSASLQSYNSLVKNYAAVTRTLTQLLPPEARSSASFPTWQPPHIKTDEERAEEHRRDMERIKQINAEIAEAAERQRREREKRGEM